MNEHKTASSDTRGFAKVLAIIGALLCLTPLLPIGLCFLAVGLFFWPVTYIVEPAEVHAMEEAKTSGDGCGWLAVAMLMIVLAGVVFVALTGVVMGGG